MLNFLGNSSVRIGCFVGNAVSAIFTGLPVAASARHNSRVNLREYADSRKTLIRQWERDSKTLKTIGRQLNRTPCITNSRTEAVKPSGKAADSSSAESRLDFWKLILCIWETIWRWMAILRLMLAYTISIQNMGQLRLDTK